jgi:hypothetical protein
LPRRKAASANGEATEEELLFARHYSHFTPRDFDLSPYFAVIKPTLQQPFNYKALKWERDVSEDASDAVLSR